VIMTFLSGGASQLDTYDLKPDAPKEIRGPYKPIKTNVSGIDICEALSETSKVFDRIALLRTVVPAIDEHTDSNVMTGYSEAVNRVDPHPSFGSVVSKYKGGHNGMPGFVSLRGMTKYGTEPGSLGLEHRLFTPEGSARENLSLPKGVSTSREADRRELLKSFDGLRREIDTSGTLEGMDKYNGQAFDMVASGAVRKRPRSCWHAGWAKRASAASPCRWADTGTTITRSSRSCHQPCPRSTAASLRWPRT
jgi:hypothetical protein